MTIHEQIRTLSNPVRLEILHVLKKEGELPASEIIHRITDDVSVPQLSQHLSKLHLHGLVFAQNEKGRRHYRLNQKSVNNMLDELSVISE